MYEFSHDGADSTTISFAFGDEAVKQDPKGVLGMFMPDGSFGGIPENVSHQFVAMSGLVSWCFTGA